MSKAYDRLEWYVDKIQLPSELDSEIDDMYLWRCLIVLFIRRSLVRLNRGQVFDRMIPYHHIYSFYVPKVWVQSLGGMRRRDWYMVCQLLEGRQIFHTSCLLMIITFFFRATDAGASVTKNNLCRYEALFGQVINLKTCRVFCSGRTQ